MQKRDIVVVIYRRNVRELKNCWIFVQNAVYEKDIGMFLAAGRNANL